MLASFGFLISGVIQRRISYNQKGESNIMIIKCTLGNFLIYRYLRNFTELIL